VTHIMGHTVQALSRRRAEFPNDIVSTCGTVLVGSASGDDTEYRQQHSRAENRTV